MAMTENKALYSIPAAYALGLAPHTYYLVRMMAASNWQWSNVTPRQNWDLLREKVPKDIYQRCLRARGAHLNALEGFPIFAASILAGSGRVSQKDLQTMAWEYLGVRTLYNFAYIGIKNEALSYVRTGLWAWSLALPVITLIKAANWQGGADN